MLSVRKNQHSPSVLQGHQFLKFSESSRATAMTDYYQNEFTAYFTETSSVDPSSFLTPLCDHLSVPARILDIGCGSGRDLRWLKERGYKVTGFERSPGLAGMAREHAGCEIVEGDFDKYDFETLSADAIVLVGALVHTQHEIFDEVFSNCLGALHGKGLVLITMKEGEGIREDQRGRLFYLWQDAALRKIFASMGFKVVDYRRQVSQVRDGDVWLGYLLAAGEAATI